MENDEVWTTKDGRKIPVGQMEESHVRNALRMLIRNSRARQQRGFSALPTRDLKAFVASAEAELKARRRLNVLDYDPLDDLNIDW